MHKISLTGLELTVLLPQIFPRTHKAILTPTILMILLS